MPTEAKRETVAELVEAFSATPDLDRRRLPRPQGLGARRRSGRSLRDKGIEYRVVKNRLARIAAGSGRRRRDRARCSRAHRDRPRLRR
ncbi:MAG: hypothetical protein WKF78_03355 [Candidatus Limnocylindrales bacterium]